MPVGGAGDDSSRIRADCLNRFDHRHGERDAGSVDLHRRESGLVGLSRALALEVVADGVTVNVVAPGYISTDSQLPFEAAAAAAGPIGRSGTAAEIAACVLFLAHAVASFSPERGVATVAMGAVG